ncbi:MAG: LysM peptidoglycan-binding domain-containing protein, partial [Sedimentitalea sp.]|nr:LysM peptidoglycan-binding domain-containing protein [Sedimentitalea sp.]
MRFPALSPRARLCAGTAALTLVAACGQQPLDFDLRGNVGAFSTAEAAQTATADRPAPDARGVITYPNYQVAVARRGDTVASVAARVGLPADELARFNGIEPGVPLREGEVIALPRKVAAAAPAPGSVDIQSLAGNAISSAPDTSPVQTTELKPAATAVPAPQAGPEPV